MADLTLEVSDGVSRVPASEWDRLVKDDNPFTSHAFLSLLERSNSVGDGTGWQAAPILLRLDGTLVGAVPAYVKSDSYGEYIFDWAFAQAAQRARIPYYPKVVAAVPFTPATGERFLSGATHDPKLQAAMIQGLMELSRVVEGSSVHVLFCTEQEAMGGANFGLLHRRTHQYHFENPGYGSFEDFLSELRSEHRKQIRKERRKSLDQGLNITLSPGNEVSDADWRTLFELYISTSGRKWGRPYLTAEFFAEVGSSLGPKSLVGFARRGEKIVAGTLSFLGRNTLYGRYWGSFEDLDSVHFEMCYYQLIERAIASKLARVEAGAQGEHKIKRGFRPTVTHSLHRFEHRGLANAAKAAFAAENGELDGALSEMAKYLPFRK